MEKNYEEFSFVYLVSFSFRFMREMMCGHKQMNKAALGAFPVQIFCNDATDKVLATASPSME